MPEPDHAPTRDQRSRRQVLAYAGVVLAAGTVTALGGCEVRLEQEPIRTPPPPTDDELARERVATEADELLDLIDEARRLRTDAAALLGRIASEHQAHVAALLPPPSRTTPSPKPTRATTAATATGATLAKATALTVLAARESAAADRLWSALGPLSGDLARLLAGIAASRACHAEALTSHEAGA